MYISYSEKSKTMYHMKEAFYTNFLNNKFKFFGTGAELLGLPVYYMDIRHLL